MTRPTAAMLAIGDEILSGRTRDANTHHLARALAGHGIALCEARVVADDRTAIVAAVRTLGAAWDHVFTSGGIGPTHDDITAEAVAAAFDTPLRLRHAARAIPHVHYHPPRQDPNAPRLRMARIPDGARLIENPVSAAPGFSLHNVHVLAGVPAIFEAMLASVLPGLTGGAPMLSQSVRIDRGEGDIAGPLGDLAKAHPGVSIGSYPFIRDGAYGATVVVRGQDGAEVDRAVGAVARLFPPAP